MSLSTTLQSFSETLSLSATRSLSGVLTSGSPKLSLNPSPSWGIGTGAGNVNKIYTNTLTISASSSTTIDLTAAADEYGSNVNFSKIKGIFCWLDSSVTNQASGITFAATVTNYCIQWAIPIYKGGSLIVNDHVGSTNYPVTAGSGMNLKLTNLDGTNSATVKLVLVGE